MGKSKKAAEHDCAAKAWAYFRSVPGLKLPSSSLGPVVVVAAAAPAAAPAALAAAPAAPPAVAGGAAAGPAAAGPAAAAAEAEAGNGAAPPVDLEINEAMIESMSPEQLRAALREVREPFPFSGWGTLAAGCKHVYHLDLGRGRT